jgi:hypothetical protein
MLKDFNPTTRMYPRTMDEAFPNNSDLACPIHKCAPTVNTDKVVMVVCAFGAICLVAFTILEWI